MCGNMDNSRPPVTSQANMFSGFLAGPDAHYHYHYHYQ
jgi:hypothetical protein